MTNAGGVQPVARQDVGDGEWMGDVGIAVVPRLGAVRLGGEDVGGIEGVDVRRRVVAANLLRQLELTDHACGRAASASASADAVR